MSIGSCPGCGRVFLDTGRGLCPSCIREEEEQFEKVSEYLRDHPGETVECVSERTGVPREKILKFIREGRLMPKSVSGFELTCRVCGRPIDNGQVCSDCLRAVEEAGKGLAPHRTAGEKAGEKAKMYTYDRIRGRK